MQKPKVVSKNFEIHLSAELMIAAILPQQGIDGGKLK
jgi:hypothetical protein